MKKKPYCPPNCCDMRGMLSFMILWLLSKRKMYGQEIASEIAKRKGEKPNPGTIYPALKSLEEKGLIFFEKKGRTKCYSLTEKGFQGLRDAMEYFNQCFGDIARDCEIC